jgi:hypothetical protein
MKYQSHLSRVDRFVLKTMAIAEGAKYQAAKPSGSGLTDALRTTRSASTYEKEIHFTIHTSPP